MISGCWSRVRGALHSVVRGNQGKIRPFTGRLPPEPPGSGGVPVTRRKDEDVGHKGVVVIPPAMLRHPWNAVRLLVPDPRTNKPNKPVS